MNINEYKKAMEEISVDSAQVLDTLQKKVNNSVKTKYKKFMPAYAIMAILLITFVFSPAMSINKPDITIIAYAAETGETLLTNELVTFKTDATPLTGGASIDTQGNYSDVIVNYNIYFKCEGENIDTITYTCSDMDITRANRSKASAYYVENITMPVDEYLNNDWQKDEKSLSGGYGEGESEALVTKLIGSSYTVAYEDQMNRQYGLVVAATIDEDDVFHAEDLTIHLAIKMTDGSTQQKKLLLHSGKDAFSEVEIRILE